MSLHDAFPRQNVSVGPPWVNVERQNAFTLEKQGEPILGGLKSAVRDDHELSSNQYAAFA